MDVALLFGAYRCAESSGNMQEVPFDMLTLYWRISLGMTWSHCKLCATSYNRKKNEMYGHSLPLFDKIGRSLDPTFFV